MLLPTHTVVSYMKTVASFGTAILAVETPTTSPTDFIYNLGALGVALACIYWLLGRGDKRERETAAAAAEERKALMAELAQTRQALIEALKEHKV